MLRLRQRSACSVSDMKVVEKKEGAKLKAKSIDFDFSNPTKLVGVEKEQSERIAPPSIETECGANYVPLLTALQLEKWEAADQLTRDMLIWIGGEGTRERNFVYFAEAKGLPMKDMKTIDDLWTVYSKGKFGYSVQKKIWLSKKVNGDFNKFVTEINWNKAPGASGDTGILRRELYHRPFSILIPKYLLKDCRCPVFFLRCKDLLKGNSMSGFILCTK